MWLQYSGLITSLLCIDNVELPPSTRELSDLILSDITLRNESLLFRNLPSRTLEGVGSAVSDVQILNSICASTNMDSLAFLDMYMEEQIDGESGSRFASKLDTLLTWSVTRLQYGDHRPYAAVTIIARWHKHMMERAVRRLAKHSPQEALQDSLFDWLDDSAAAGEGNNLPAISLLFGEFVEKGLFSYSAYIERLIARGESGLSFAEVGARESSLYVSLTSF
jgi:mediator of RNA polymerase II transcription subunit 12, fungi type